MKKITLAAFGFLISASSASIAHAQLVDCKITIKAISGCEAYTGKKVTFQMYDGLYENGTSAQCARSASKANGIPERCAQVQVKRRVGQSAPAARSTDPIKTQTPTKPEVQKTATPVQNNVPTGGLAGVIAKLENINTDDGVSESEIQYAIGLIISFIQNMFATEVQSQVDGVTDTVSSITGTVTDTVGGITDSVMGSIPFIGDDNDRAEQEPEEDEFYTTDEDFETDPYGVDADFNTFATRDWDGTEIARMVDPYGKEQFTSDGKHFYDNEYDAAHSQEGLSNVTNIIGDTFSDVTDFFFVGKNKDSDIQLQNSIAGEVLSDSQSQSEKDVEKAYEKISGKIKTPIGGDIPAKVIIMVAEESKKTDFAQGVRFYISERKKGGNMSYIRQNFSQQLSGGYGTFKAGVSQSTVAKQAEGVLYARYEESYQRYLLAKQLGRTE